MKLRLCHATAAFAALVSILQGELPGQTVVLDPVVVTATRSPGVLSEIPASVRILDADELARTPALSLDGALRSVPGFSLFRRSDSLTSHPTAQGVSLRGLGPSGASRTLVLLDGVPVNDPFGGWVAWGKLPRLGVDRVEIVRGGGTAWGNAALGGVVHILTRPAADSSSRAQLFGGSHTTASAEALVSRAVGSGSIEVTGRWFNLDGLDVVAPESTGPVDIAASQRHRLISGRAAIPVANNTTVTIAARYFDERRGNGTPLQNNRSRESAGLIAVEHRPEGALGWTALLFAQDQEFSSTFSSVNAQRTSEVPASDQFSVPATAWGLAWTGSVDSGPSGVTTLGADFRAVRGETNEDSGYSGGAFTRRRVAGGSQQIGGIFATHSVPVGDSLRIVAGLRGDRWNDSGGFRRETLISSGSIARNDVHADRSGWELSPSAGVSWKTTDSVRFRLSAQRTFRRPTLNELYRPFRVGAFITEANPDLRTEKVNTFEGGFEWGSGPVSFSATAFHHELRDAVANVTLVEGPGSFPEFGFIPAGGAGRKRLNLHRVVVRGVELSAGVAVSRSLSMRAEYLLSDARVRDGSPDRSLDGKTLAQVPRHSATFSLNWRGPAGLEVTPRVRVFSRQFEDDGNELPLAGAGVVDLFASFPIGGSTDLYLTVENLWDERVETGKSSAGVTSIGTPRMVVLGVRTGF